MEGQEWIEALFIVRLGLLLAAAVTGLSGGVLWEVQRTLRYVSTLR